MDYDKKDKKKGKKMPMGKLASMNKKQQRNPGDRMPTTLGLGMGK